MAKTSNDDESKSPTYNRFMQNVKEELERINDNDGNYWIYVINIPLKKKQKNGWRISVDQKEMNFGTQYVAEHSFEHSFTFSRHR